VVARPAGAQAEIERQRAHALAPKDSALPDPPALVTDTHPLLLHAAGGRRLSRRTAAHFDACERREALTYVPAAVAWETSLLVRVGRVNLRRRLREFFEDLFSNPAYQPMDLTLEQVYLADEARPNADPFDGLICAAARSLGLPLITRDREIQRSGLVRTIW
jgi:PIN domain nuclease of toxin-antitoxin system